MQTRPPDRRGLAAAMCLVLSALTVTSARDADVPGAVLGGPSVLLSYANAASPYTGIGRYEGRATCTAFFLDTLPSPENVRDAPAYALTDGRCAPLPGPNGILIDREGLGRVIFNLFVDSPDRQIAVPVVRTPYATVKGRSLAVLELGATYRALKYQLIRPWPAVASARPVSGDPIAIVGAPLSRDLSDAFLRLAACRLEGVAPVVLEHLWHWFDAPFNRCRDIMPGSAGSPVLSVIDRRVLGIVTTTNQGAREMTECALDHPCEPATAGGILSRPNTNYMTSIAGLSACFDRHGRFAVMEQACPLEPGAGPQVAPEYVGPVNPRLRVQPRDPARATWNVTVSAAPLYHYAVVTPPFDDCRTSPAYGAPHRVSTTPAIDAPLPDADGFVFLCVRDAAGEAGATGVRTDPAVIVARIDSVPPRLPAQVTIAETDDAWHVRFSAVGDEVAFHLVKTGPPAMVRCDETSEYRQAPESVRLPRATGPYRVCAIPHDAARNPGRVFERVLR